MILLLTGKRITGLSDIGTYPGSVTVPDDALPDDFGIDFEPGKWLYINGSIFLNPDFKPLPKPSNEPTVEERLRADIVYLAMMSDVDMEES